jgi:sterol desaturase/sphingolipid hydroxylase (fatty acid hydroxylase superfamily)
MRSRGRGLKFHR